VTLKQGPLHDFAPRAGATVAGITTAATELTAALARSPRPVRGLAMCGGAFVAMAYVMFTGPGPGAVFPLTLGSGGLALFCSILAGARAGTAIKPHLQIALSSR
jgi:hypothetical protein